MTEQLGQRQARIMSYIQTARETTRKAVSQKLDLPLPTVNRLVSELRESGLLVEVDDGERLGPGRPNASLRVDANACFSVGVDVRRNNWRWSVVDAALNHLTTSEPQDLDGALSADGIRTIIAALAVELRSIGIDWEKVSGLVFAAHAVVSASGDIYLDHEKEEKAFNLDQVAADQSDKPCSSNDPARTFSVVERDPIADGPDAAYVLFGNDGLGMGVYACGDILRSFNGICGEIGHLITMPIVAWEPPQAVMHRTSGSIIVRAALEHAWARELTAEFADELRLTHLCTAAATGHEKASMLLRQHLDILAPALASTVSLLGCTTLVIGGEWTNSGNPLREHLLTEVRRRVAGVLAGRLHIRYANNGTESIAQGAAQLGSTLVWSRPWPSKFGQ